MDTRSPKISTLGGEISGGQSVMWLAFGCHVIISLIRFAAMVWDLWFRVVLGHMSRTTVCCRGLAERVLQVLECLTPFNTNVFL